MSLKPFLSNITFEKDCRTFKAADRIEFEAGITALVGINGCGKSTLLDIVREHFKIKDDSYLKGQDIKDCATVETNPGEFGVKYFDFHAGDKKYAGSFGNDIMGQIQAGRNSSGIGNLIQFDRTGIKNCEKTLIILDEPDRGLAQKLQLSMAEMLAKLSMLRDNQIIVSTHSTHIMDLANRIYSVEHKKYFNSTHDFLREHLNQTI